MISFLCKLRKHNLGPVRKYTYGDVTIYVQHCACAEKGDCIATFPKVKDQPRTRVAIGFNSPHIH